MAEDGAPVETEQELRDLQLEGLRWTVGHANKGSAFYRGSFDRVGVTPDDIRTLEDLRRLPFTKADDLREGYPLPLVSVPPEDLVRIHSSSGTTGKRKILAYTAKDVDDWREMFARCYRMAGVGPGDRAQIAVGYGLWTAGVGFQAGCEEVGAMAIPVGPGNLDLQCQFLVDLKPNVICCTASMALLLAEQVHERGLNDQVDVETVILGSECCGEAMRSRIMELFGAEHIYDITGMTELYGPGAGIDCSHHEGIHFWADYYIAEVLDPETLDPVPEGEQGELVVTTLRKEGAPLIRYRTRDLTRLIPGRCPCGSLMPRHERFAGRTDDMFIFRAVNVYPTQIEDIIARTEGVGSEYNVTLERESGKDHMRVRIERSPDVDSFQDAGAAQAMRDAIKSEVMVACEIEVVDHGSLPRSERKSKRVFDNRREC